MLCDTSRHDVTTERRLVWLADSLRGGGGTRSVRVVQVDVQLSITISRSLPEANRFHSTCAPINPQTNTSPHPPSPDQPPCQPPPIHHHRPHRHQIQVNRHCVVPRERPLQPLHLQPGLLSPFPQRRAIPLFYLHSAPSPRLVNHQIPHCRRPRHGKYHVIQPTTYR